ncbi:MAG: SAM-dependent methyltransferase, partial [Nitrospiria bacterium]
ALSFSKRPGTYDKILIKETIHHIPERGTLFENLFERLEHGGIMLLVHVPPEVEYPLFEKALERCKNWHADPDELTEKLKKAGFRVKRDSLRYPHAIPKHKYFEMVRNCYMSALTSLDESEIEEGLKEMGGKYRDHAVLRFYDHFDYLKAVK